VICTGAYDENNERIKRQTAEDQCHHRNPPYNANQQHEIREQ
jgi:hypothetical protein